jgi:hypothetical protein
MRGLPTPHDGKRGMPDDETFTYLRVGGAT